MLSVSYYTLCCLFISFEPCYFRFFFFFFNDTATTEIYTLSLHDALPISPQHGLGLSHGGHAGVADQRIDLDRSEEHTSELQSHLNLVCRLLLEKKKKKTHIPDHQTKARAISADDPATQH